MNLLRALFIFLAIAPMQHCTRYDSPHPMSPVVSIWTTASGAQCAKLLVNKQQWIARPVRAPEQTFSTQQEAVTWIETNYCQVDAK